MNKLAIGVCTAALIGVAAPQPAHAIDEGVAGFIGGLIIGGVINQAQGVPGHCHQYRRQVINSYGQPVFTASGQPVWQRYDDCHTHQYYGNHSH